MSEFLLSYPRSSRADVMDGLATDVQLLAQSLGAKWRGTDEVYLTPCQLGKRRTTNVLCVSHWLKMIGANTRRVLAQMIEFKTFWDRAYSLFVEQSMSREFLPPDPYRAVSPLALATPVPDPAGSFVISLHNRPQIIGDGVTSHRHPSCVSWEEIQMLPLHDPSGSDAAAGNSSLSSTSALAQHRGSVTEGGGS